LWIDDLHHHGADIDRDRSVSKDKAILPQPPDGITPVKSKLTQRRFKAHKASSCPMCKPWKQGWEGKRTISDYRKSLGHDQELKEAV
jgi:hypothetical protein